MSDLVLFMMTTLDGYYEGPGGVIDWHHVDDEFNEFAVRQLDDMDALLFGRTTYELMASYWPTEAGAADDPDVAQRMNAKPKYVVSKSLDRVEWDNTTLLRGDAVSEVARVKERFSRPLILMGSGQLATSLAGAGLIDEYRVIVNPVALGAGRSLFAELPQRLDLHLQGARSFASGSVLLTYRAE